ncbi:unnamed protein product [Scytosiphon promiscuus]
MADSEAAPTKHFIHTQASHFTGNIFFFYAYGNTPPTDLLQHVPHDADRADLLCLGCGDLRDLLYSILLHGRRGVGCGPVPRHLSFALNDWEPAIHARNLMLLQMILDARDLVGVGHGATDGITRGMDALTVGESDGAAKPEKDKEPGKKQGPKKKARKKKASAATGRAAAFAQKVGAIFSAMFNMFVDPDTLEMIHDVAARLAVSAASPEKWSSTELGRIVQFADDRSQDRVCKILTHYGDASLQEKGVFMRMRQERTAFLTAYMPKGKGNILSRAMGLASLCQGKSIEANDKMRRQYLREGILDPFPLLLNGQAGPAKPRGPFRKVNPLLLVTERKGVASSLHYGAFPLDAFHTDVSWWKLRPENLQDAYSKLAPRVTKHQDPVPHGISGRENLSAESLQNSWFGTALEELAQMCGAFLAATDEAAPPADSNTVPDESAKKLSNGEPRLNIIVQVGDALNFCDALLTTSGSKSPSSTEDGRTGNGKSTSNTGMSPGASFAPVSFQQASVHPLHLRDDVFRCPPEFDVISTNNLAEHLGITNLLVASAPLLKTSPYAVLLTSLMASLVNLHKYKNLTEFQEKLMCMSSHAAGILLGVVPVSSLSSFVGHADTMTLVSGSLKAMFSRQKGSSESAPSQLRLVWKRPTAAFAESTHSEDSDSTLVDMTLKDFVDLTLPIYKRMSPMAGPAGMDLEAMISMTTTANHYTSVSFIRLIALAGRRIRLRAAHFRAVLNALMNDSSMILASNLSQEQMALFHALDLARMRRCDMGSGPIPVDTRRAVLLVPKSGLDLLREFKLPGVYMSVTGATEQQPFDNHFTSVHMAFVRVHRGGYAGLSEEEKGDDGWRSLNDHLMVRDTWEDDPEAELMVSALVPTVALVLAVPALTQLQLRPRESIEVIQAPKSVQMRLGRDRVIYGAGITDVDRVAILVPVTATATGRGGRDVGGDATPVLACPAVGVTGIQDRSLADSSAEQGRLSSSRSAVLHRFTRGNSTVDQSIELVNNGGTADHVRLVFKVTLLMVNEHARDSLAAAAGEMLTVENTRDPCSLRMRLGEGLTHTFRLPFPAARRSAVSIRLSKRQGFVELTVPLLVGTLNTPFSLTSFSGGRQHQRAGKRTLPSTIFWPPCAPLSSLPRLDLKAEWAHNKVMGFFSFTPAEESMRDQATTEAKGGVDPAVLGLKESFLAIASTACMYHDDELPIWTHPWVCISENRSKDEPALWVWVNEILLDSSNEALVLDCCIMPVDRMEQPASAQLRESIALQHGTSSLMTKAYAGELDLWAALLPVAVERARQTYAHSASCSYGKPSKPHGARWTICSCGKGKDLPPECMHSLELANQMGGRVPVHPFVYRAALSPLYAPPDSSAFMGVAAAAYRSSTLATASGSPKCAKCGNGGNLKQCTRCRKVRYCSRDCQRQDWNRHKPVCA